MLCLCSNVGQPAYDWRIKLKRTFLTGPDFLYLKTTICFFEKIKFLNAINYLLKNSSFKTIKFVS